MKCHRRFQTSHKLYSEMFVATSHSVPEGSASPQTVVCMAMVPTVQWGLRMLYGLVNTAMAIPVFQPSYVGQSPRLSAVPIPVLLVVMSL